MRAEIKKFWIWWEKNEALIRKVVELGSEAKLLELKEHIDRKILSFGHFTWEITEGEKKKYNFVISPNREFERLQLSKQIIKAAPEMTYWDFHYAKQINQSPEPFKLYDENQDPVYIDPSAWQIEIQDAVVHVDAADLTEIDEETRNHAMDLVVTAYFGEEFRITRIKEIKLRIR
ncbi:MAG: hypothetical protein NXI00_15370 [Cytophagales bacterium]|nr:hypothetical protein [Cytophagales bacterium]